MVGALVVNDDGVVVGRGAHAFAGGPHAEVVALNDAGPRAKGATLYCTLEPCNHTGRTGPCAPRVAAAGIRRAVIAMTDPNPIVSGRGVGYLREHGVSVTVGTLSGAALRLNRPFVTVMERHRPFVTMKAALSADGKVAGVRGARTRLTGPAADRYIHRERAEVDAIAVGAGTVLADDPLLTPRIAYRQRPLVRVIFDRRLRTPPSARVLSTLEAGPVIIVTTADAFPAARSQADALEQAGALLEVLEGDSPGAEYDLRAACGRLMERGVTSFILEGGPTLHRAAWQAGLVDRVQLFVTPRTLGEGAIPWLSDPDVHLTGLDEVSRTALGDDIMIEGYVHGTD
jgi:diaminohydroxyphosphoribosylaminopyrimidine deaminase/5-amino-6-(5-phosphoribosylamino)uracil reductase